MQNKIEIDKTFYERLNLRHAETKAERDRLQQELQELKSKSTGLWSRATVAAVSIMAVSSLLYTSAIHDAQSNVNESGQNALSASNGLEALHFVSPEQQATNNKNRQTGANKKRSRFSRTTAPSQQQWGPLLVLPEPEDSKPYFFFDPLVKQLQENLLTLGFDLGEADGYKGEQTRQSIAEFRALYLPDSAQQLQDADLAVLIETYANLARSDAARFGVDQGVVAAIRLSSVRTGVDFSYLMKLAAAESNFRPEIEAATSSATGIYQFTHDTWLNTLKKHGAKYGLVADYAANIEYYETRYGRQRPTVRDESMYQHLLALRKNPRISAIMAAEMVSDNQQKLAYSFDREPTQADLYLTHFLGTDAAITFLRSLEKNPDLHAVELFPEAARSNHKVFHPQTCAPRTVDEVYTFFGEKFTTSRYDDFGAN
jgi:hypothetical protein